jgi:hypothetical protein
MLTGAAVGAFDVIAQGENCVTLLYSTQFCVVFLLLTPSAVQLPLCLQKRRHQRRHPLSKALSSGFPGALRLFHGTKEVIATMTEKKNKMKNRIERICRLLYFMDLSPVINGVVTRNRSSSKE